MASTPRNPVIFIVGPTAVGKTEIGIRLCRKYGGEIVSADSMQVYRGMDIGTAKPSRNERAAVPHHMIDVVSPAGRFSVFDYRQKALDCIYEITQKGRVPFVVGGSGLYVRALLEGFTDAPGGDVRIRRKIENEIKSKGLNAVYKRLAKRSPGAAVRIKPTDKRRIIRALEILEQKGNQQGLNHANQGSLRELGYQPRVIGFRCDRSALYRKIEQRIDQMFQRGFYEEALKLAKGRRSVTAWQAVGYRQLWEMTRSYRRKGKRIPEDAFAAVKEMIKRNTRRFAKRQLTWFKKEKDIRWIEVDLKWSAKKRAHAVEEQIKDLGLKRQSKKRRKAA